MKNLSLVAIATLGLAGVPVRQWARHTIKEGYTAEGYCTEMAI